MANKKVPYYHIVTLCDTMGVHLVLLTLWRDVILGPNIGCCILLPFFKVLTDILHQLRRRYLHAELITLPALDLGSSLSLSLTRCQKKKVLNQSVYQSVSQSVKSVSQSASQSVNKSRIFTSLF